MLRQSGCFNHEVLGTVRYVVRANSRRIVATWKDGVLRVSLPPVADLSVLSECLDRMATKLLTLKPYQIAVYDGQRYEFPDFAVTLRFVTSRRRGLTLYCGEGSEYELRISSSVEPESEGLRKAIAKAVIAVARNMALQVLLPRARQIAQSHDIEVSRWQVSAGRKLLGRCSSRGVVSLSAVLMLLPVELRDYVVCHELAHITEMNHSAAFHRLCDAYCGGRERELEKALRHEMKRIREELF